MRWCKTEESHHRCKQALYKLVGNAILYKKVGNATLYTYVAECQDLQTILDRAQLVLICVTVCISLKGCKLICKVQSSHLRNRGKSPGLVLDGRGC